LEGVDDLNLEVVTTSSDDCNDKQYEECSKVLTHHFIMSKKIMIGSHYPCNYFCIMYSINTYVRTWPFTLSLLPKRKLLIARTLICYLSQSLNLGLIAKVSKTGVNVQNSFGLDGAV
jgi:hypothetical protein